MPPPLRPAADLLDAANAILAAERSRLAPLLAPPLSELVLTGGSSVAGALTKGDVDLHLRVERAGFAGCVAVLGGIYDVVRLEIWQDTLATFDVPGAPLPTGVAVTPIGSAHDLRFRRSWELLAADPALLAAYNAMKLAGSGYEDRKSAFFDRLMASS
jgi:hypothetical protein